MLRSIPFVHQAVFLSVFTVLAKLSPDAILVRIAQTPSASPLVYLRPLLAANMTDPNTRYLAMKCLLLLPATLWTGVSAQQEKGDNIRKAVTIEEQEVGNIMSFMESRDSTLRLLVRADSLRL